MSGNDSKILLDLNFPDFQLDLFDLDVSELKKVFKALKKINGLTWNEVFRDRGLRWEEVKSLPAAVKWR